MELLKGVMCGMPIPKQAMFWLKAKAPLSHSQTTDSLAISAALNHFAPSQSGETETEVESTSVAAASRDGRIPVELRLSRRTDAHGALCGVVCVVLPSAKQTISEGKLLGFPVDCSFSLM